MSSLLKKALLASLESEENTLGGELNPDTEYEALVEDPELVIPQAEAPRDLPSLNEKMDEVLEAEELVETLESIADMAEGFVTSGTASAQTALLLQTSVEAVLSRYDVKLPFEQASLESLETSFESYHTVSCEGLREFITRLKENIKSAWKSFKDDFTYSLKTRNEKLIQVDRRLREARAFIKKRGADLKKQNYSFQYGALVKLMRVNDEVQLDFSKAIESDHKFLDEMLNKYQGEIVHTMQEMASALSSGNAGVAIEKMRNIKHPARHVSSYITTGFPLMGNYGVRLKEGKVLKKVALGELGFNSYLYVKGSTKQLLKEIGYTIIFGSANAMAAESAFNGGVMTLESLTKGIDTLDAYVKMVRNSINNSQKSIDAADKLWAGFEKLKEDGASEAEISAMHTAVKWFVANSDRPFDGLVDHALFVMGCVISFAEQLSRRLK